MRAMQLYDETNTSGRGQLRSRIAEAVRVLRGRA